jgi:pyruvate carboxylase
LNVLDEYEEFDAENEDKSLFIRTKVKVNLKGEKIETYAYLYNRQVDAENQIISGDFLKK